MAFLLGKLKKVAEGPESGESGAQVLSKPAPRRSTNRDADDHKVAVTAAQVLKQVEAHQRKLGPEAKDAQRVLLQSPVTPGFGGSGGHSDDFTFADLARRGELAKQFQYSESHRFPLRATALDAAAKKRKIAKLKRASGASALRGTAHGGGWQRARPVQPGKPILTRSCSRYLLRVPHINSYCQGPCAWGGRGCGQWQQRGPGQHVARPRRVPVSVSIAAVVVRR